MASNHAEHTSTPSSPVDDLELLKEDVDDGLLNEEEIIAQLGFTFSNFRNSTRIERNSPFGTSQESMKTICVNEDEEGEWNIQLISKDNSSLCVLQESKAETLPRVDENIMNGPSVSGLTDIKDTSAISSHNGDSDIDDPSYDHHSSGASSGNGTESEETDEGEFFGDLNESRKRKKRPSKDTWKKHYNQKLRMEGKTYVGYRRTKEGKVKQDVQREERKQGATCKSKMCEKSQLRECNIITEEERKAIFKQFWEEMSWDQRRVYITGLVDNIPRKRPSCGESRRKGTLVYHLQVNSTRKQVCKKMFLNTFGIKDWTVRYWKGQTSDTGVTSSTENRHPEAKKGKKDKTFVREFLENLPKLPSHYCRKMSTKLYLEPGLNSVSELFDLYKEKCKELNKVTISRHTFDNILSDMNIALFRPKKDECDICVGYKTGNVNEYDYQKHTAMKEKAREEKAKDKAAAESGKCRVFTMDLQAVKVAPFLKASAVYYKTKLAVHNFTMYELANHDVTCYWFDESEADLVASTFSTCIIDTLKKVAKYSNVPIILYSDGCTYQNRNTVLSNALLKFAMKTNITVFQKFLEKGHTQMECDSVHSAIECRLKSKEIFLPSQYATVTRVARKKPFPYKALYLDHTFFIDYSDKKLWMYDSIRPGRKPNDPTVTDLRVIKYDPKGVIYYKLDYNEDFQELPKRPKAVKKEEINRLYMERLKIKKSKWDHLQQLKTVLPHDCHLFYDNIPHL